MTNLATISVEPSTEYQNLGTLAGVTFTSGNTYVIQIKGDVLVCEANAKPTTLTGFHIFKEMPFEFVAGSNPLWIRNLREYDSAIVNIAD